MKSIKEVLKRQAYVSPRVEVIEIESQGSFCSSVPQTTTGVTGDGGIQFENGNGQW